VQSNNSSDSTPNSTSSHIYHYKLIILIKWITRVIIHT
jgi:hypothetical protein